MFETDPNMGADLVRREMTVREFLESATAVGELVVVTCLHPVIPCLGSS